MSSIAISSEERIGLPTDVSGIGFSDESEKLQEFLQRERFKDAIESLNQVYRECSEPNWDGYDSASILETAYSEALKLLFLLSVYLPISIPMPEIVPEPIGEIGFEWHSGRGFTFVVSVSGNHMLTYVGVFGNAPHVHGTEHFTDSALLDIIKHILRLYSQGH